MARKLQDPEVRARLNKLEAKRRKKQSKTFQESVDELQESFVEVGRAIAEEVTPAFERIAGQLSKWPWQRCKTRDQANAGPHGLALRCDFKKGHEGPHYVERAFESYFFDKDGTVYPYAIGSPSSRGPLGID